MTTKLVKVEGSGNDFLLGTGSWARRLADDPRLVVRLCNRRRGIGADGVLAVFPAGPTSIRLAHRNADGSPSDFCANGTRCAARAAVELLDLPKALSVITGWAEIPAVVQGNDVSIELPSPTTPSELTLSASSGPVMGSRLSVGIPHFVVPVTDLAAIDMDRVARPLRHHPDLGPPGANVHLVEIGTDKTLAIRSFERGVESEVLCCGSGVVAAALVTMARIGRREITVVPRSGDELRVEALGDPPTTPSRLTGRARLVAEIEPL